MNNFTKIFSIALTSALALTSASTLMAQQGFGTNSPDKSSVIDMKATDKGFLAPRVALTSLVDVTTVPTPANALTVFNTATTTTGTNDVTPGFYYYSTSETKWVRVSGDLNGVDKTDDAWINDPSNSQVKLGTTSAGATRAVASGILVKDDGKIGIGTETPVNSIHIVDATINKPRILLDNTSGTNNGSSIGFRGIIDNNRIFGIYQWSSEAQLAFNTSNSAPDSGKDILYLRSNAESYFLGNIIIANAYATNPNPTLANPSSSLRILRLPKFISNSDSLMVVDESGFVKKSPININDIDRTNDAWKNNPIATRVELNSTSTGAPRTSGTEFVALDNGKVGIGTSAPNATLQVMGSVSMNIRKTTSNTETIAADDYTVLTRATGASTFSLPDPSTCRGRILVIVNHLNETIKFNKKIYRDDNYESPGSGTVYGYVDTLPKAATWIGSVTVGNRMTIQSTGDEWTLIGI